MENHVGSLILIVSLIGVVGCDSSNSGGGASMDQMAANLEAQNAAQQKEQERLDAERKAEEARQAAAASQAPAERPRTEAGRAPIGEGGYFTAIAGARRHVLNKVEDWPWTQAVQHFQATEGRLPKDHNEFMKKIVEPLGINLGFKEEGQEFLYDPTPDEDHPWGTVYVVEAAETPVPE